MNDTMPLRRSFHLIFINLLILGLGIFAIELFFGGWIFQNRLNRLNIPRDVTTRFAVPACYRTGPVTVYHRDKYGFRGTYRSVSDIDILTCGGSTTDQRYISEGHTWQDVLHSCFEKAGKTVSVVNAGINGQSTYGHIKNFEWWFPLIPGLRAKYILFYVGINDFYRRAGNAWDDIVGNKSLIQRIKARSAFAYLYRTLMGMYYVKKKHLKEHPIPDFPGKEWKDKPLIRNHAELMKGRLAGYHERLLILAKRTRELGSIPIFVTQSRGNYKLVGGKVLGCGYERFENHLINGVDIYYMMSLLNETTVRTAREADVPCFDLARELRFTEQDYMDFVHNSPKGAAKIGQYLFDKLKPLFFDKGGENKDIKDKNANVTSEKNSEVGKESA